MGCPWLPALLRDALLSSLCRRWEFVSSTTSTTGSFWPSQRQFQHRTRPSSSATYVAWASGSTLPRVYSHPANEYCFWAQLSCRWQQLSQRSEPQRFSATRLSAQSFPENAGPDGSSFASTSVGSASHATHPVLAEAEGSLGSRTPPRNGDSGLCITPRPWVAQSSALCFSSNRSATAGTQASQGATTQTYSNRAPLEEPAVGVGVIPAAQSSPVANPFETGPSLSSERHAMASTAQVMGPTCVAAQREPFNLPERVLNMMAEVRASSTRCLYSEMVCFLSLVSRPRLRFCHLRCVSGSFISAGEAG